MYLCALRHYETIEEFEARVKLAKECGFTHYDISALTDRTHWCIDDPTDPWLQWNLSHPNFFKRIIPKAMEGFVPAEEAKKEFDMAKARGEVLKKHGMKAVYAAWEPSWMPEGFFKKYPRWRGPRIDHPRRTRNKRFAPCMDHPEVLAMYREMVTELVTALPMIDTFFIMTNDSGAGMCWSEHLYNNANGPEACKNINMGTRISGFMKNIEKAATDAGATDVEVHFSSQLSRNEANATLPKLPQNMYMIDWNGTVDAQPYDYGWMGNQVFQFPFNFIPRYYALSETMLVSYHMPKISVNVDATCENYHTQYMHMIKHAMNTEVFGRKEQRELLLKTAAENVGDEASYDLVRAWELVQTGLDYTIYPRDGGDIISLGLTMQRWINRPFVPFPLELTHEEKDYYQKHQFQASGEDRMADMMNVQDTFLVDSRVGANYMEKSWTTGFIGNFNRAISLFEQLIPKALTPAIAKDFQNTIYAMKTMICFAKCAINCAHFQTFMYEFADNDGFVSEVYLDFGDRDREFIYNIYRKEIDNMYDLMDLLEACPEVITYAPSHELEDCFTFSPELKNQIAKKIEIMDNHWQDFDRIFPRPNM